MVEASASLENQISGAEQTLAFFDSVFEAVHPVYRQVDKEYLDAEGAASLKGKKDKKAKGKKNVSLLELNELAHERVEEIRRANALKSQQRIKELTVEH